MPANTGNGEFAQPHEEDASTQDITKAVDKDLPNPGNAVPLSDEATKKDLRFWLIILVINLCYFLSLLEAVRSVFCSARSYKILTLMIDFSFDSTTNDRSSLEWGGFHLGWLSIQHCLYCIYAHSGWFVTGSVCCFASI
jgi:hypothetical protein